MRAFIEHKRSRKAKGKKFNPGNGPAREESRRDMRALTHPPDNEFPPAYQGTLTFSGCDLRRTTRLGLPSTALAALRLSASRWKAAPAERSLPSTSHLVLEKFTGNLSAVSNPRTGHRLRHRLFYSRDAAPNPRTALLVTVPTVRPAPLPPHIVDRG